MRILNRLGGIELSNAYTCIKAISKKKLPMIAKYPRGVHRRSGQAGLEGARGRRAVRHDRKIRRLRLQQEPFDRLRADRLHDGLSQGPLPGRVHGGAALRRHSGPQFQEEGLARRAFGRLPADEYRGGAARREPLRRRFSSSSKGEILFGLAAIKGCGVQAAEAIHGPAAGSGPVPQFVRLLRTARPRDCEPHGDRIARQGRRVGFCSAHAARKTLAPSNGRCNPAPRRSPTGARARRGCSKILATTSRRLRPPLCPTSRSGTIAIGWPPRKKCWASISPATRWPSTKRLCALTARTPRPKPRRSRTARK